MNVFDDIQFYLFNHHHYIDEPADSDRYSSTWVDYPNANFNILPGAGHLVFDETSEASPVVDGFVAEGAPV